MNYMQNTFFEFFEILNQNWLIEPIYSTKFQSYVNFNILHKELYFNTAVLLLML